jgi:hypothetical protein
MSPLFTTRIRGAKWFVDRAATSCACWCATAQATSQVRQPMHRWGIGNKKLVHPLLPGDKTAGCQNIPCPRFDPEWNQRCFLSDGLQDVVICLTLHAP